METKKELRLIATQAATKLQEEFDIGEFSNSKDEPAKREEIINSLLPFLHIVYELNY